MVSHTNIDSSTLPFKVEFSIDNDLENKRIVNKYSKSYDIDFVENLEINEYSHIILSFINKTREPIEARLYMDCFDYIDYEFPNKNDAIVNGEKEYIEIGESITIHHHQNNDVGKALIPGVYKLYIDYNGEYYYSQILINPKNINNLEHQKLIKEIEESVSGLSRDWSHINKTVSQIPEALNINITNLDICIKIIKEKHQLDYAMRTILNSPYLKTTRNYVEKKRHKSLKLDSKALIYNQIRNINLIEKNFDVNNQIITVQLEDDWNNKVNVFLLKVINQIIEMFTMSLKDCNKIIDYQENEIKIIKRYSWGNLNKGDSSKILGYQKSNDDLKNLKRNFNQLLLSLKDFKKYLKKNGVQENKQFKLSQQFVKTKGYNIFYKYYLIISEINNINLGDNNQYNWKPTELLYEYWTYLKLLEYLEIIGFETLKNPLKTNQKEFKVNIPDGTTVEMEYGDCKIEVIFNEMINKNRQTAIQNNHFYWIRDNRRKPDIRLNIFKKNSFDKLLVFDAKYTNVDKFWKKSNLYNRENKVVEQLKTYANNIVHVEDKRIRPVEFVIALCPTLVKNEEWYDSEVNHSLGVATLKPGTFNNELLENLERLIFG